MRNSNRLLMAIICILTFASIASADRPNRRQMRQNIRAKQGRMSGKITGREMKRLKHSKHRIQRAENRAKHDGEVTQREKRRLESMQDARSRQIKRLKHNDQSKD